MIPWQLESRFDQIDLKSNWQVKVDGMVLKVEYFCEDSCRLYRQ